MNVDIIVVEKEKKKFNYNLISYAMSITLILFIVFFFISICRPLINANRSVVQWNSFNMKETGNISMFNVYKKRKSYVEQKCDYCHIFISFDLICFFRLMVFVGDSSVGAVACCFLIISSSAASFGCC